MKRDQFLKLNMERQDNIWESKGKTTNFCHHSFSGSAKKRIPSFPQSLGSQDKLSQIGGQEKEKPHSINLYFPSDQKKTTASFQHMLSSNRGLRLKTLCGKEGGKLQITHLPLFIYNSKILHSVWHLYFHIKPNRCSVPFLLHTSACSCGIQREESERKRNPGSFSVLLLFQAERRLC